MVGNDYTVIGKNESFPDAFHGYELPYDVVKS